MERQDPSLNQQFNEQYDEVVKTLKERAIWRVGEQVTEREAFRCECPKCGYESQHQRFDTARHRLLFGRSIRQIEDPRPMIRCQRCSVVRHTRDVEALVVPTTIRLKALVTAEVSATSERTATLPTALTNAVRAFAVEASAPLCRALLAEIADETGPDDAPFVEAVGWHLLVPKDQILRIVATLG